MGARVFIQTRDTIVPTRLMKEYKIVKNVGNPRLYMFHDEFTEEQFGRMRLENRQNPETGADIYLYSQDYTKDAIEWLGTRTTNDVIEYYQYLWHRPTPFWEKFKKDATFYALAKRDYLKAITDAGIVRVAILAQIPDAT